jgi:hypothetical protein
MTTKTLAGVLAVTLGLSAAGCGTIGPKRKNPGGQSPAEAPKEQVYEPDLSKPDGPMLQILRAAQDRDEAKFKASFAPTLDLSRLDTEFFKKFRRKVLTNKITPVPESVQQLSDTEAIVKLRSSRGREIPVHVGKFEDKWLITKIEFGKNALTRFGKGGNKGQ